MNTEMKTIFDKIYVRERILNYKVIKARANSEVVKTSDDDQSLMNHVDSLIQDCIDSELFNHFPGIAVKKGLSIDEVAA
jgi:3'-phosphoadenosine 5'-phosphosulfate (PAPS) 3'-phosphatase